MDCAPRAPASGHGTLAGGAQGATRDVRPGAERVIGSVAHLAYHLGAIRQIDDRSRGQRPSNCPRATVARFDRSRIASYNRKFSPRGPVAQLGARVNGIHEVTGSIPVWSTILRSPSASSGWQAIRSESPHQRRMVSSVARSAKEDRSHFVASLVLRSASARRRTDVRMASPGGLTLRRRMVVHLLAHA